MIEWQELIDGVRTCFEDYILYPINNMHPVTDLLDILLLTGLLYYLYRFVRRRRAGKLLLGIAALFGIFMICSVLDMKALGLIMDNFLTVGLVAIVIIFQPELRDALERVGSTSLRIGRFGGERTGTTTVDFNWAMLKLATGTYTCTGNNPYTVENGKKQETTDKPGDDLHQIYFLTVSCLFHFLLFCAGADPSEYQHSWNDGNGAGQFDHGGEIACGFGKSITGCHHAGGVIHGSACPNAVRDVRHSKCLAHKRIKCYHNQIEKER